MARVDVLALFPLLAVLGVWLDLDDLILISALSLPALLALASFGSAGALQGAEPGAAAPVRGTGRQALLDMLAKADARPGQDSACFILQIDGWDAQAERFGAAAADTIAARVSERLTTAVRGRDVMVRLGDARFGIALHPLPSARLGVRDTIVARLQAVVADPIAIDGTAVRLTACVGHASLLRADDQAAETTLAGAEAALVDAIHHGPGTVRAYRDDVLRARRQQSVLSSEVESGIAGGEIKAWFQPQVNARTGVISGFEALARWHHPTRGVLAPAAFLASVEEAGQMPALGASMLTQALTALSAWDAAGVYVPSVSVNFSAVELRDPGFADAIKWEIDRFDLRPARLTVEILETVAAEPGDDRITTTLQALHRHGIGLDLDDFGIGQASLSAIRRFGVNRIKIDKSFVFDVETAPEQRAMVAAILSMAQHLDVETLAEGVESEAVQDLLAQMGCHHVQGYHISRPMPFDDTLAWITDHAPRLPMIRPAAQRSGQG